MKIFIFTTVILFFAYYIIILADVKKFI